MTTKNLQWFQGKNCTQITIKEFRTVADTSPKRERVLTDAGTIDSITRLLKTLPVEGDMFVSFNADTPLTHLELLCDGETSTIEFYRDSIKTPGTTFYADTRAEEKQLVALLKTALKN